MKDLHGDASRSVSASPQACHDLLCDVEGYPRWHPDVVRRVEVLERVGRQPARIRATLHAAIGPVNRDLELVLDVSCSEDSVSLSRVANERSDRERFNVRWHVRPEGGDQTRVELVLDAALDVPRLLPTGGLADSLAAGFVQAAARELGGA